MGVCLYVCVFTMLRGMSMSGAMSILWGLSMLRVYVEGMSMSRVVVVVCVNGNGGYPT